MSQINGGTPGSSMTVGALSGAGGTIALGANTAHHQQQRQHHARFAEIHPPPGTGGPLVKQGGGILTLTGQQHLLRRHDGIGGRPDQLCRGQQFRHRRDHARAAAACNGRAGTTTDISSRLAPLAASGGTFDTNGNNVTLATGLTGTGGLTKQARASLNLTGINTYTGPTAVSRPAGGEWQPDQQRDRRNRRHPGGDGTIFGS